MLQRTAELRELARALGCMVVVTPQKPAFASDAEAPSESFTSAFRQDGLEEVIDTDFQNEN
jgi:hypothetical protein